MNLYEAQSANRRKTVLLFVLFVVFFGLLGLGFDFFYLGYGPRGEEMLYSEYAGRRRPHFL